MLMGRNLFRMSTKQEKEFFEALSYISTEKGVDVSSIVKKLESAIILAVRKQYGGVDKINVVIDTKNLNFNVSFSKLVVEDVKNPLNEISLQDAKSIYKYAKIGEYIEIDVDSKRIGRLAAQAAKQQIMQGIREVERENILEKMGGKVGRILTAQVEMIDPVFGNVVFKIDGNEVILFKNQQLLSDNFSVGDMVKVYAIEVDFSGSGSLIKISRTHPDFVKKLFELEVPEIEEGKIEIKRVARQPGVRSKIAVCSYDENLDPIGCCIGSKGMRIESVMSELNGEKIDMVKYSDEEKKFVASALSPASVTEVEILKIEGVEKIAYVSVPASQTSLAIGVNGVNVKLAAMLTGFKIDISTQNVLGVEGFKSTVQEKLKSRLKKLSDVKITKWPKKSKEEIDEEEDIHALEVERMLRECDKVKKVR